MSFVARCRAVHVATLVTLVYTERIIFGAACGLGEAGTPPHVLCRVLQAEKSRRGMRRGCSIAAGCRLLPGRGKGLPQRTVGACLFLRPFFYPCVRRRSPDDPQTQWAATPVHARSRSGGDSADAGPEQKIARRAPEHLAQTGRAAAGRSTAGAGDLQGQWRGEHRLETGPARTFPPWPIP
jgi:hypothetical protein